MKMKKIVAVLLLLCLYATAALSESLSADEEGNAELEQGNIFNIDALTVKWFVNIWHKKLVKWFVNIWRKMVKVVRKHLAQSCQSGS